MKAIIKETGKIIEVEEYHKYLETGWKYKDNAGMLYKPSALDFSDEAVIGYWTRLEHQYAGMAMQGISRKYLQEYRDYCLGRGDMDEDEARATMKDFANAMADVCNYFAHALVEKMRKNV